MPSNGFEFFRSLIVLSAGLGYDFWTMAQMGEKHESKWYKWSGKLGFVLFFVLFLIGVMGLTGILELDIDVMQLSTSCHSVIQFSIPFQWVVCIISFVPPCIVVFADSFFKPKDKLASEGYIKTERRHRK